METLKNNNERIANSSENIEDNNEKIRRYHDIQTASLQKWHVPRIRYGIKFYVPLP